MNTPTSYLPSFAALHVFLAQHPDLAAPPLSWTVSTDGSLHALVLDGADSPDGLAFLGRIAEAAGASVTVGRPYHSNRHDELRQLHRVEATVHGFELYASVSVPAVEQQGGAE